jgi:hypothetical protein
VLIKAAKRAKLKGKIDLINNNNKENFKDIIFNFNNIKKKKEININIKDKKVNKANINKKVKNNTREDKLIDNKLINSDKKS